MMRLPVLLVVEALFLVALFSASGSLALKNGGPGPKAGALDVVRIRRPASTAVHVLPVIPRETALPPQGVPAEAPPSTYAALPETPQNGNSANGTLQERSPLIPSWPPSISSAAASKVFSPQAVAELEEETAQKSLSSEKSTTLLERELAQDMNLLPDREEGLQHQFSRSVSPSGTRSPGPMVVRVRHPVGSEGVEAEQREPNSEPNRAKEGVLVVRSSRYAKTNASETPNSVERTGSDGHGIRARQPQAVAAMLIVVVILVLIISFACKAVERAVEALVQGVLGGKASKARLSTVDAFCVKTAPRASMPQPPAPPRYLAQRL